MTARPAAPPRGLVFLILLVAWLATSIGFVQARRQTDLKPTVILVSFDGWRWDYHTKVPVSNLRHLMARGVRAQGLIPSFPSKTFPNHYAMVTGLYPGHHGIVANNIFDEPTGRSFSLSTHEELIDPMWWGGQPLWVGAERAGQRAATMFWPGSEAPIEGVFPSYYERYNEELPASERVRWVLQKLDLPAAERPTFLTLYFEDTDTAGHEEGPDSQAVRDAAIRADSYLGQLTAGLEARGLLELVNIVVVSDHGMAATNANRIIAVDDYISLDDVVISDINPGLGVFPKAGKTEALYRALKRAHPRLRIYRRDETPAHWHYRQHPRIPPIVGVADEGWQVLRRGTATEIRAGRVRSAGGQHGYDPRVLSMRGIFVAAGPAFRQGVEVRAFENVNVYDVVARILGVPPVPNDGNPQVARSLLREPGRPPAVR